MIPTTFLQCLQDIYDLMQISSWKQEQYIKVQSHNKKNIRLELTTHADVLDQATIVTSFKTAHALAAHLFTHK